MRRILGIAVILAFAAGAVQAQEVVDTAWMKTSNSKVEVGDLGWTAFPVGHADWTWTNTVWDGPSPNPSGSSNPVFVAGDYWAFWSYEGRYTKHWFKTTLEVCRTEVLQEVRLVDKYKAAAATTDLLSINDDLYVYVNGGAIAAGGTGVSPGGGTLDGTWTGGKFVNATSSYTLPGWGAAPYTGWYIAGGLVLDSTAFTTGPNGITILTDDWSGWGGLAHPVFKVTYSPACYMVDIDIKPGSYPNSINCSSKGVVPVGILGSAEFDPTTINESTIALGGINVTGKKGQSLCHWENFDLDGDGYPDDDYTDLVCQIPTYEWATEWNNSAASVTITGETTDGSYFRGSDSVRFVPDK